MQLTLFRKHVLLDNIFIDSKYNYRHCQHESDLLIIISINLSKHLLFCKQYHLLLSISP